VRERGLSGKKSLLMRERVVAPLIAVVSSVACVAVERQRRCNTVGRPSDPNQLTTQPKNPRESDLISKEDGQRSAGYCNLHIQQCRKPTRNRTRSFSAIHRSSRPPLVAPQQRASVGNFVRPQPRVIRHGQWALSIFADRSAYDPSCVKTQSGQHAGDTRPLITLSRAFS
jgi:hypothetical protein